MKIRTLLQPLTLALPCIAFCVAAPAWGKEYEVVQKNKSFMTKSLKIKVGDSIKFVNDDSFAHNLFSLSPAKSFDMGSFGSGQNRSVVFDKPGKIEVECSVHPDMMLEVEVAP